MHDDSMGLAWVIPGVAVWVVVMGQTKRLWLFVVVGCGQQATVNQKFAATQKQFTSPRFAHKI